MDHKYQHENLIYCYPHLHYSIVGGSRPEPVSKLISLEFIHQEVLRFLLNLDHVTALYRIFK